MLQDIPWRDSMRYIKAGIVNYDTILIENKNKKVIQIDLDGTENAENCICLMCQLKMDKEGCGINSKELEE